MKRTIVIAGLGLIGGSLAKAISQSNEDYIIGYDTNAETIEYALKNNIIDKTFTQFTEAAKHADMIKAF